MMKPSMSCEDFRTEMVAFLAETLEPEQALALHTHKGSCQECEKIFESSRDLLSSFSAYPASSPRPYVIENLERSIEAAQRSITLDSLWARLWSRPTYRMISAMALGLLAAFVSTLSFSQVADESIVVVVGGHHVVRVYPRVGRDIGLHVPRRVCVDAWRHLLQEVDSHESGTLAATATPSRA